MAWPAALAASMALPPPIATTTSASDDRIDSASSSIAAGVANLPNGTRSTRSDSAAKLVPTASSTRPQTTSSATTRGRLPIGATNSPRRVIASLPWT